MLAANCPFSTKSYLLSWTTPSTSICCSTNTTAGCSRPSPALSILQRLLVVRQIGVWKTSPSPAHFNSTSTSISSMQFVSSGFRPSSPLVPMNGHSRFPHLLSFSESSTGKTSRMFPCWKRCISHTFGADRLQLSDWWQQQPLENADLWQRSPTRPEKCSHLLLPLRVSTAGNSPSSHAGVGRGHHRLPRQSATRLCRLGERPQRIHGR